MAERYVRRALKLKVSSSSPTWDNLSQIWRLHGHRHEDLRVRGIIEFL